MNLPISISIRRGSPTDNTQVLLLPLAEYVRWQEAVLASSPNVYRVRKWGDPVLVQEAGSSVALVNTSNFQAVGLYNKATGFGGVSNYLWLTRGDIDRLAAMQVEDDYVAKIDAWLDQKMRWLAKSKGTIYFYGDLQGGWPGVPSLKWGTIALGGNLVQVEGLETLTVKTPDGVRKARTMARLAGFRKSDWNQPVESLLARGLVHRCFCAYSGDSFGDSPKGICYSPFYSPLDWDFAGNDQPQAFYLPFNWLEPKA